MNRLFGISKPEKQLNFTLTIDLVTAVVSGLLIFFLMGYFDGARAKTGASAPPIVYLVYLFLGLVSAWQFLSFFVGLGLKSKLSGRKRNEVATDSSLNNIALTPGSAQQSLPPAEDKNIASTSVTEASTRNLEKIPRR